MLSVVVAVVDAVVVVAAAAGAASDHDVDRRKDFHSVAPTYPISPHFRHCDDDYDDAHCWLAQLRFHQNHPTSLLLHQCASWA